MTTTNNDWHASLPFYNSQLFHDVQLAGLFKDSKTFADATPKTDWNVIIALYEKCKSDSDFTLANFIAAYFTLPEPVVLRAESVQPSVPAYINQMWQVLTKQPDVPGVCSLIPLKRPYIVPGGRFREIYYWDSYFTALGLMDTPHHKLVQNMLENFLDVQATVGLIPNGNRAYYHTRSQPPILGLMAELVLAQNDDQNLRARCLAGMELEYEFWMQGKEQLTANTPTHRRIVRMANGAILNRYYDDDDSPRPESYSEDIKAAESLPTANRAQFYRDLRAACESGWDFSSRWLADPANLTSICTTQIVPIDLNSLMYLLEKQLALGFASINPKKSDYFANCALERQAAINHFMWDAKQGLYRDYNVVKGLPTAAVSAAILVPLFVGLSSPQQADDIAKVVEQQLLKPGGIITTIADTEQQWDAPNGWAPLQWFAVKGLRDYGYHDLAKRIMENWLTCVEHYFNTHQTLLEKYNVCDLNATATGGEYTVQFGFGWTNGVSSQFYQLLANDNKIQSR
jgi:alpha,alpha-trehalase